MKIRKHLSADGLFGHVRRGMAKIKDHRRHNIRISLVDVLMSGLALFAFQMLGAAIVHPQQKAVIPLVPEPIIKQDGETKNDCERNAAKRLLKKLRQDHPRLPLIVVEDAWAANAPHIRELKRHGLRYIIGVKPGDHTFLFDYVGQAQEEGRTHEIEIEEAGVIHFSG